MKNWISTVVVVSVSMFGLAHGAAAQEKLSQREKDYGAALARSLGKPKPRVSRQQFEFGPVETIGATTGDRPVTRPQPPGGVPTVTGISVQMDDASVQRLRFQTPEQAQQHLDWLLKGDFPGSRPVTGELRGNQLVLVRGDEVNDPDAAKRMTAAAWEGLPAPDGPPQAAFTQLEDGSMAVSTTLKDGALRESIDRAMSSARETQGKKLEGVDIETTPTTAEIAFPSGFRAGLQSDEQGASVYTAKSPEAVDAMKQHLAALGGHPASGAVEGTAKIIEGLFGRR